MKSSTVIARVFGIPIRVHITLWILLPLIALNLAYSFGSISLFWGLLGAVGLFASVAVHELGHSVVAMSLGCRVREIMLLPIGGVAQLENMPAGPRGEFLVALAGPVTSIVLALLLGLAGLISNMLGLYRLAVVLAGLAGINFMLALFNLLPSFPMDGGRIYRAWMTPRLGRLEATRRAARIGRIMAVIFGILGLLAGNIVLVAIAVFIYMAAGAEYRTVRIKEMLRRPGYDHWPVTSQPWEISDNEVYVSPPPYHRGGASHIFVRPLRAQHDLFDELYHHWE